MKGRGGEGRALCFLYKSFYVGKIWFVRNVESYWFPFTLSFCYPNEGNLLPYSFPPFPSIYIHAGIFCDGSTSKSATNDVDQVSTNFVFGFEFSCLITS